MLVVVRGIQAEGARQSWLSLRKINPCSLGQIHSGRSQIRLRWEGTARSQNASDFSLGKPWKSYFRLNWATLIFFQRAYSVALRDWDDRDWGNCHNAGGEKQTPDQIGHSVKGEKGAGSRMNKVELAVPEDQLAMGDGTEEEVKLSPLKKTPKKHKHK